MTKKSKFKFSPFSIQHPASTSCIFFSLSLLAVGSLLLLLSSCSPQKERTFKKSKILMDTIVTITVVSQTEEDGEKAIDSAFSEMERLQKLLDFYSPDSEISLINREAGVSEVKVSPDTFALLAKALSVSEQTGGAFDVSVGTVSSLYDFRNKIKPDDQAIEKNLVLVGYRNILMSKEKGTVFSKKKEMLIDTGGIAKGYAADRAAEVLKNNGIRSGLVSVAGDIRTFGTKPDGSPWKIGIRNPRPQRSQDDLLGTVDLKDVAISTSGDYERFFILNGQRYHHLLSPRTGRPARECRSVSVIAKESVLADAFATAIFILGPEKGMEVLETAGIEGVIVDDQGVVHTTPGIREKIEFQKTLR